MDSAVLLNLVVVTTIYYLLAMGFNLQYGTLGLLNLGVHGFFALGAYTYGLLTQPQGAGTSFAFGLEPLSVAIIAVLISGVASVLITAPALLVDSRTRSPYLFPILTLACAEALVAALSIEVWLAGGHAGLFGIPAPISLFTEDPLKATLVYGLIGFALALLVTGLLRLLRTSPFGWVARAIRDDELAVRALGHSPMRTQLFGAALGGCIMGLAGVLWAGYLGTLQPSGFTVMETLLVVIAVTAGGRGSLAGGVLGSILVFSVLTEFTRFLPNQVMTAVPSLRPIVLGVILVVLLRFRPEGIWPEKPRALHKRRAQSSQRDAKAVAAPHRV